ncbi:MAG: glycine cleavage system protein R [Solirubrobacterales bacterium]
MLHLAVSAVGRDRPGIVSAVSEALLAHRANIEDSQMAILRGHFAMTLIVSAEAGADARALERDLRATADRLGLDAMSVSEIGEADPAAEPVPSHLVSVYGADHPGIVHAVSSALAGLGVTITDLETRLAGDGAVYAMQLEVALPGDADAAVVEHALAAVAGAQRVEVAFRPLEHDTL